MAITDAMTTRALLAWDYGPALTASGAAWLRDLGIADTPTGPTRRAHVRTCLDWTERRPHLAGAVGASLFRHALDAHWLVRQDGTRIVTVTDQGRDALRRHLLTDSDQARKAEL